MSDMITTELAAVYFHIYPEAANRIWFSAKRRLLIELMRLSCSRLENQLTKTKNKNRFWSSFRTQRGNRSERCSQSYREQCLAPAAWFLFEVSAPNMYRGNFLITSTKAVFTFPKEKPHPGMNPSVSSTSLWKEKVTKHVSRCPADSRRRQESCSQPHWQK